MLRIPRRGPIADLVLAASPDRRFACFCRPKNSHEKLYVESDEFMQLSLRMALPGLSAGSLFEGRSAPPQTRFARAGSVELHFCLFYVFKRLPLRMKNRLKQVACTNSCLSRPYHTFVVFQGSNDNRGNSRMCTSSRRGARFLQTHGGTDGFGRHGAYLEIQQMSFKI